MLEIRMAGAPAPACARLTAHGPHRRGLDARGLALSQAAAARSALVTPSGGQRRKRTIAPASLPDAPPLPLPRATRSAPARSIHAAMTAPPAVATSRMRAGRRQGVAVGGQTPLPWRLSPS